MLPLPESSTVVLPEPPSKCHKPRSPLASVPPVLPAQVVPQAPQLPASLVVVSQTIGVTTPTRMMPLAPVPMVCAKVNPLAPDPVALASTATSLAPLEMCGIKTPVATIAST